MDVVLIILGVLGMGAIVIAAYVFTVAARNYVSNDAGAPSAMPAISPRGRFVLRDSRDRRRNGPVSFPLTINNAQVIHDRRQSPDRRAAA